MSIFKGWTADPGITDDEGRTIAEMMAKGTYASIDDCLLDAVGYGRSCKGGNDERKEGQGIHGRGTGSDEGARPRAEGGSAEADGDSAVLAKIAEMQGPDRAMAERLHEIVKASAPALSPKTWYGMPAYAKDGKVVCFFQSAQKFNSRYATLGFSDKANLDEGAMWPTSFALKELTDTEEAKISALVKRAVSQAGS
jgi:uncharacterized protein YdhG (YjbR/CyaY superfamily)